MLLISIILGLLLGSFAAASVWRLRARQLVQDKKDGELVDAAEFKQLLPLTKVKTTSDYSRCLHCGERLRWYDLVPLFSWLSTGGRCRYCKKQIGRFEPIMEIVTAILFVVPVVVWSDANVILYIFWWIVTVLMVIQLAYDAKWFLLPNVVAWTLIALGLGYAIVRAVLSGDMWIDTLLEAALSVGVLSGTYFLLYEYSKWRFGEDKTWVGFGDVKLCLALGLLLLDWRLAFLTLFLANFIGLVYVLPGLISKKMGLKQHVPFGPFLIIAFFVSLYFGQVIIDWYSEIIEYLVFVTF